MWRYATAGADIPGITASVNTALTTSTYNAGILAGLAATGNAAASGGVSYAVNFAAAAPGALDGGIWAWSSTLADIDPGPDSWIGSLVNTVGLDTNSAGGGDAWILYRQAMSTDSCSVVAVLGSDGQSNAPTYLICHANTAGTVYAYACVYDDSAYLGYRSGGSDHMLASKFLTIGRTDTIEINNQGTTWRILRNGVTLITYTDAGAVMPTGATQRCWGARFTSNTDWLTGYSFALSSITASDIAVPTYIGTGWSLLRTAAGTVSCAAGWREYPTTIFNVVDALAGVTLDALGPGRVIVNRTGWYSIVLSANMVNFVGGASPLGLYWGATAAGTRTLYRRGGTFGASSEYLLAGAWTVYLSAGNILAPAINNYNSNPFDAGDGAGTGTYFAGSLVNP